MTDDPQVSAALLRIAQQMYAPLKTVQKGYITRSLFGGLHIVLERRDRKWRLAIGRTEAPPGPTEAKIIAAAFGIKGLEWHPAQRVKKRKVRRRGSIRTYHIKWHVLECEWIEVEQKDDGGPNDHHSD